MHFSSFIKKEWVLVFVLFALAAITRYAYIGQPDRIVFDEVYFGKFVTSYFLHAYYFDIHPPLAKLIMSGIAKTAGIHPVLSFGFNSINDPYPDSFFVFLRAIVSFFGTILPLGVYALSRSLSFSKRASFLAGLCVIFDNALLVQSRFILTDTFLLAFGTFGLALVIYASRTEKKISYKLLCGGAFLLGASYSVKWTGLLFLGMAFLYLFIQWRRRGNFKKYVKAALCMFAVSFVLYASVMCIHLNQLYKTGTGDAFMSEKFQSTLLGNPAYEMSKQPNIFSKFTELNSRLLTANAGITGSHPYGSKWYTWPLMYRGIYYWNNTVDTSHEARIYLIGNPVIWWSGLISMCVILFFLVYRYVRKGTDAYPLAISLGFLCAGYFANLFAYIPIERVAFLYHYFPSFMFMAIAIGYALDAIGKKILIGGFVLLAVLSFLYFSPLSYGLPLSQDQYESRMLIESWK